LAVLDGTAIMRRDAALRKLHHFVTQSVKAPLPRIGRTIVAAASGRTP
jgi:hypothetical protein